MTSEEEFKPTDRAVLNRCIEFVIAAERRASEIVEVHDGFSVQLNPSIPNVWDANRVVIDRAGITTREIVDLTDAAIGAAGMKHRTAYIRDCDFGRRLAPEFEQIGWIAQRGLFMVLRREPDKTPDVEVFETSIEEVEDLQRSMITGGEDTPGGRSDPLAGELIEWDRRLGAAVEEDRWFIAMADGRPAATCRLIRDGGIGQVESVGALDAARGRGLGRAVAQAAAAASKEAGDQITFISAVANDWPRLLYDRIGFEAAGEDWAFRLQPGIPEADRALD